MDPLIMSILANSATAWSIDKLIETFIKSKELTKSINIPDNLFPTISQDQTLNNIARNYRNDNLVLVLGAGISMDQGIPNWTTLLQRLITKTFESDNGNEEEKNKVFAQLFDMVFGPNPLIAARYLSLHFEELERKNKKKHLFEKAIRESLYESYDSNKVPDLQLELIKFCVSPARKHSLDSVLTYNYDDLIEQGIEKLGLDVPYKSIFELGVNPTNNQLPIFHVHGFLPQKGQISKNHKVTLGDDSYHLQYNEIYRWSNLVQLQKFKDLSCLFVGVSLTDPNQRRLLDIAKEQRGTNKIVHYLIKKKYAPKDIEKVVASILKSNNKLLSEKEKANLMLSDTVDFLVKIVEKFESNDARSFGIEIIWVDDYTDIPPILKQINKLSQDNV